MGCAYTYMSAQPSYIFKELFGWILGLWPFKYTQHSARETTVVQFPMAGVVDRLIYLSTRAFSSQISGFVWQALSMIRYRLGSFWLVVLRSFWRQKQSRKQDDALSPLPQSKPEPPWVGTKIKIIEEKPGPYSQGSSIPPYTLVEEGDIITRDSDLAHSLYPSSAGINNPPYLVHDAVSDNGPALDNSPPNVVIAEQDNIAMRSHIEVKVSLANIRIKPVMPEATQRYDRRSTL